MVQTYLHGGTILPLAGEASCIEPGVVVFDDAHITFVGPAPEAPPPHTQATVVDCTDQIILPGLVNSHTHTGMSYFRNLLEDMDSADWFRYELQAEKYLTREDIYWAALLGAYELLRQGVTTIADRFSHMDVIVEALR